MSDDIHPDDFGGTDDESHLMAQRSALAGSGTTRVRFETSNDDDASRIVAVLGALGYTCTRTMTDQTARDRWALAESAKRYSLSPSEHDVAAQKLGLGTCWIKDHRYIESRMLTKLAGKTLEQALAEIAEVRP